MSHRKWSLAAIALLSLSVGASYAQAPAKPPTAQAAPQQGSRQEMMQHEPMMGRSGMTAADPEQTHKDRGIVGISLTLDADAVGAPARLVVGHVVPYSPAYYAGIEDGDQITAVDGQSLDGKSLGDIAQAVRGEMGSQVKLSLSRQGQKRDVSLTRVEPVFEREGRHRMREHRMMDMMDH